MTISHFTHPLLAAYIFILSKISLYKLGRRYIIQGKLIKSQNFVKTEVKKVSRIILPDMVVGTVAPPALDGMVFEYERLPARHQPWPQRLFELLHRHSIGTFAILLLIVGASATQVTGAYQLAHITMAAPTVHTAANLPAQPLRGPNMVVASHQLSQTVNRITSQTMTVSVGSKTLPVSAETIKSWLKIVPSREGGVTYIQVNKDAINKSLNETAAPYIKAPTSQVAVTRSDGSTAVIAAGRNGAQLGDITPVTTQLTDQLLGAKGLQLNLPVESLAFATVSPSAFDKLIEVNVVTKQMWLYDKGQLVKTYPISAGAPDTPTLIGQFKIYSKLSVQDMRGFNADGSRYFQPKVKWVNYFAPGGYAIHGNYWRPLSWFGAVNSSHGCVSLPDNQAKEVYDWAPLGTTVITHY